MKTSKSIRMRCGPLMVLTLIFLGSCSLPTEEELNLTEILPEGAMAEITQAHPEFAVSMVPKDKSNVSSVFDGRFLHIAGVEDPELRERLGRLVVAHLENPNKKEEDKSEREAYNKLPPKEKMSRFVERMTSMYTDFEYEWVGLGEGNVKLEYFDNTLLISGVQDDATREEIAHGLTQIQKEIDQLHAGEQQ